MNILKFSNSASVLFVNLFS